MHIAVFARHDLGQFGAGLRYAQARAQDFERAHAAAFVADVARPLRRIGAGFAQIVAQAGKAHGQGRVGRGGSIEHQAQVHAGIHLRVVLGRLGHAPQSIDFGQDCAQCTATAQHL